MAPSVLRAAIVSRTEGPPPEPQQNSESPGEQVGRRNPVALPAVVPRPVGLVVVPAAGEGRPSRPADGSARLGSARAHKDLLDAHGRLLARLPHRATTCTRSRRPRRRLLDGPHLDRVAGPPHPW